MKKFEPWPWAIGGMLAAMIASSLSFYAVAATHRDEEVVSDSYAAGLEYSRELRKLAALRELGVAIELANLDLERLEGSEDRRFQVRFRDGAGNSVPAEAVQLRGERPAESGLDWATPMTPNGDTHEAPVPDLRPGRWTLLVEAEIEGRVVMQRFRHLEPEAGAQR